MKLADERRFRHRPRPEAAGPWPAGLDDAAPGHHEPIRQRTLVALRWVALAGQASAVLITWLMGADLPMVPVLAVVVVGAELNLALALRRTRMTPNAALAQLTLDTLQTGMLLTLTGGTANPFGLFVLAPLTLGASVLPRRHLLALGAATAAVALAMSLMALPLRFRPGSPLTLIATFDLGHVLALAIAGAFFAASVWRVSNDLAATENALLAMRLGLAREQRLQHLGGVVAAAAHEMGTPLATIKLIAAELADDFEDRPEVAEDLALLRSSADRCRDILRSMGRAGKDDLQLHTTTLAEVLAEAAAPHRERGVAIGIAGDAGMIVRRDAAIIHALRNLIQNAVDFAATRVSIDVRQDPGRVEVTIRDDGPGYPAHLMDRLGEPYLTTRRSGAGPGGYEGMGLGLFIARTLLERSGARVRFSNDGGAVSRVDWPAAVLMADDRVALGANPAIFD